MVATAWDVRKAALCGAILGAIVGVWNGWSLLTAGAAGMWSGVGSVVGGAIGGAVVGTIASLIRNRFLR